MTAPVVFATSVSSRRAPAGLWALCLLAGAAALVLSATAGAQQTKWRLNPAQDGNWFVPNNWDNGVPTSATDAFIENAGTAKITAGIADANQLDLGVDYEGTLRISGTGDLKASTIRVGLGGVLDASPDANWIYTGELNVLGGSLTGMGGIVLDFGGSLNVTDGNCQPMSLEVGGAFAGAVQQTGGAVAVSDLRLGMMGSASGTYEMSGDGNCNVMMTLAVGDGGTGVFSQTGGHVKAMTILVGRQQGASGTYSLGGTGRIGEPWAMTTIHLGEMGTGVFNQDGGVAEIEGLTFGSMFPQPGQGQTGSGTYNLTGGQLRVTGPSGIAVYGGQSTLIVDGGELIGPNDPGTGLPGDVSLSLMDANADFTFGGTNGRLSLNSAGMGLTLDMNKRFTQTGGTTVATSVSITGGGAAMGPADPVCTVSGGQMALIGDAAGGNAYLAIDSNGTFNLTDGGAVTIEGGSLYVGASPPGGGGGFVGGEPARCDVSGGELIVAARPPDANNAFGSGGKILVGESNPGDSNGILTVSGGTIRGGILRVAGYKPWMAGPQELRGKVVMAGGTIVLTGEAYDDMMVGDTKTWIGGRLEGRGTIRSARTMYFEDTAELVPEGGVLTLDATLGTVEEEAAIPVFSEGLRLPIDIQAGAGLRTRGDLSGPINNAGLLASYGGDITLSGEVVNGATGTLANGPFSNLFVHAISLVHVGNIEARTGGGVSFNQPITNDVGRTISLLGGGVAAPQITNAPGGAITGTGTIDGDLTNHGTTDFFGPAQIFGALHNQPGGHVGIRNGDLLVTGHTTNDGTIKVTNGQAFFEGGLTDNGTVDIDPARAVVVGPLLVMPGGVITLDANSTLQLMGEFANRSTQKQGFDLSVGTVQFHGFGTQQLEAAGEDVGTDPGGWADNFAFGRTIIEPGSTVALADLSDNQLDGDADAEAVYVDWLVIEPGGWIETHGIPLYYRNGGEGKELLYGDSDLGGDLDHLDYLALKRHYGTAAGAGWSDCDTDGDGDVDYDDYVLLRDAFESISTGPIPPGGSPLPEPATLTLLAALALPLLRRRRRAEC